MRIDEAMDDLRPDPDDYCAWRWYHSPGMFWVTGCGEEISADALAKHDTRYNLTCPFCDLPIHNMGSEADANYG